MIDGNIWMSAVILTRLCNNTMSPCQEEVTSFSPPSLVYCPHHPFSQSNLELHICSGCLLTLGWNWQRKFACKISSKFSLLIVLQKVIDWNIFRKSLDWNLSNKTLLGPFKGEWWLAIVVSLVIAFQLSMRFLVSTMMKIGNEVTMMVIVQTCDHCSIWLWGLWWFWWFWWWFCMISHVTPALHSLSAQLSLPSECLLPDYHRYCFDYYYCYYLHHQCGHLIVVTCSFVMFSCFFHFVRRFWNQIFTWVKSSASLIL